MSAETEAGLAALQSGDINGAIAQLERAAAVDPTDFQAQLYLGAAYGQAGRQMEAVTTLAQAVTLQPSNAQARYNLAIAYENAGYKEQAATVAQQALQLQPDYPKAQEMVARLSGTPATPPGYTPPAAPQYGQPSAGGLTDQPTAYGQLSQPQAPYVQPAAPQYGQLAPPYAQPPQMAPYGAPGNYGAPSPYQAQGAAAYGSAPVGYGMGAVNTSGMKSTVPPEIAAQQWNWGAFYFSWIWCFAHGMPLIGVGILLLNCIGGGLVGMIILGVMGNKLGWQNRRFDSVEHYMTVQRIWAKWALGIFITLCALAFLGFILLAILVPAPHAGTATP